MLRKAIVLSFDVEARTALVEYWGDTERRIESVGVAAHVDAAMLAVGAAVEVWAPAESRPDEALVVASRAAPASLDQTIVGSHDRLDNIFGAGNLATPWYNRQATPASPNSHDAEMTASPTGANGWAWAAEPSGTYASGWSMSYYPHHMYVWTSIWNSPDPSELRCTDAGNIPRYKEVILYFYPASSAIFRFRSVKDASNYTEIELSSAGIKGYKRLSGVRTQVGATVPIYPIPYWLQLGNLPGGNFLTWAWGAVWGPGASNIGNTTDAGLQAADIDHVALLFHKGTVNFEIFWLDAVRFHA